MVTKEIKISDLIRQHPGALDKFMQNNPELYKMHNITFDRSFATRVTVEQAAYILGIDLEALLDELNDSKSICSGYNKIGMDLIEKNYHQEQKMEIIFNPEKVVELDVRPILSSGKDPLKDILAEVKKLDPGYALLIINTFEPFPLYNVLGKKGFQHRTESENGIYRVYFYKEDETNADSAGQLADTTGQPSGGEYENVFELDVHDLQPPEPMMKILENLNRVDEKTAMVVFHHREPHLLYPRLDERGYKAACIKIDEDKFKIIITKKRDS